MALKIAIIAGESSGDLLGAGLMGEIKSRLGGDVSFLGVGGPALVEQGLVSLFDFSEIAIMGITAVIGRLPRMMSLIRTTSNAIINAHPDVLVIIDSPGFTHRVAKRVRRERPDIPIVQYVSPTVWAWKEYRAPRMKAYVDHVLAILPFEPAAMERLGGPPTTYVGHRLRTLPALLAVRDQLSRREQSPDGRRQILLLPGSRSTEVERMMPILGETAALLTERGDYRFVMPTVPHQEERVRRLMADWPVKAQIVMGEAAKWEAYGRSDAALACAGTVLFELALSGIPTVTGLGTDFALRRILSSIKTWSGALPNLVADYPVFPEFYDDFLRPAMLARMIERLSHDTPQRASVIAACSDAFDRLTTETPANARSADIVLDYAQRKSPALRPG